MSKARSGDFFEDRRSGRTIAHLAPRTVMEGHRAHHAAACPTRFASRPSDGFARLRVAAQPRNQRGAEVLSFCRWLMVRKPDAPAPAVVTSTNGR